MGPLQLEQMAQGRNVKKQDLTNLVRSLTDILSSFTAAECQVWFGNCFMPLSRFRSANVIRCFQAIRSFNTLLG